MKGPKTLKHDRRPGQDGAGSAKASGKPTKKEVSERKEASRKKRAAAAKERKASAPKKERENPIKATVLEDGTVTLTGRSLRPTKDKNAALAPLRKQVLDYGVRLMMHPDGAQANMIARTFGCVRAVRNDYLSKRIEAFSEKRETLNVSAYKKGALKLLKEERPWLREVDKFALEAGIEAVDAAYANFFDGRGSFPRFASRYKPNGNRYTTKQTSGNIRLVEGEGGVAYIRLPKIGMVPVTMPDGMSVEGIMQGGARILKATVSKDGARYSVSLGMEKIIDLIEPVKAFVPDRVISMDMGLHWFCDYSNGDGAYEHVENPRWIQKNERKLRRLQRSLSRKRYDPKRHRGSKNWRKAKAKVGGLLRKISDQRRDFHHKLSRKVADRCDVFICEGLNIKGMLKNRHLAGSVSSVGWGQFLTFVKYKVERGGGIFLKVSRWFPSSKACRCGYKNTELTLKDRYWICPKCHKFNDRDDNAVDNLRAEGIRLLAERGIMAA